MHSVKYMISSVNLAVWVVILFCLDQTECGYKNYHTHVISKLDRVVYVYPNQVRDERGLRPCEPFEVCGVINKRFWFPPLVNRQCICPSQPCGIQYSPNAEDNRSVFMNPRAQFKLCEEVNETLHTCKDKEIGIKVLEEKIEGVSLDRNITMICNCKWPAYWQLTAPIEQLINGTLFSQYHYQCKRLNQCQLGDFCGHIRTDTYSTYNQCACPRNSVCLNKDRLTRNASEILYSGPTYRAYCIPVDSSQPPN